MSMLRAKGAAIGLLLASAALTSGGSAIAQSAFTTLDRTGEAQVNFSGPERGAPILAGSTVKVSGQKFRPGQKVTLLYGTQPLPGGSFTADAEGKITGSIAIPANAVAGSFPIIVVAEAPYFAAVEDLKVSPTIPLSGQQDYKITQAQTARGVYQSAYSAKNNALFTASSQGRPPVANSELVKLDGATMKILARVTPAVAPEPERRGGQAGRPGGESGNAARGPGVYAVYGIGVDDAKDTVWATNSRQNTVAVYKQSDLSLVKQFPVGTVNHARDAVIDSTLGKAYVSATFQPEVKVFDTATLGLPKGVAIKSLARGKDFSAASLSLDPAAHKLYVVSNATNEVAVINTRTDTVEHVFPVPGGRSTIGISHDPQTGRIYVAGQGSDNLVVLDGTNGAVIADTPVGAGALNVVFDPVKRRAYVANRGASTIAVTDADGKLVANLGPAPTPNHVALGKGGTVYAVNKSANATGEEADSIMVIQPK